MTTERRCENCYFYDDEEEIDDIGSGLCRIDPPMAIGELRNGNLEVKYELGWPDVYPKDWCGKHHYNNNWHKKGE